MDSSSPTEIRRTAASTGGGPAGALALLGGRPAVDLPAEDMYRWCAVTREMEDAVLAVLRDGAMSGTGITKRFEAEYARWSGSAYALAHSSGTAALQAAMYAAGVGRGDEVICPTITYWASCAQALSLGASVVFADIDPETLCLCPRDFERRITPRTKAVVVVHYLGVPADMDAILPAARRRGIKVIEDVSHAQGARYKGRMVGTFGDVSGISLMTGKSFAIGEGGMLTTNERLIYERALFWGHYERHDQLSDPALRAAAGLPSGGNKYRMHQMSSAVGLEQIKKYDADCARIAKAHEYFWRRLEGVGGVRPHLPPYPDSTKGGWYAPHGFYDKDALGGLSVRRFCEAVAAEGLPDMVPGCNAPLHECALFNTVDVYGDGLPTNWLHRPGAEAQPGDFPAAAGVQSRTFHYASFKDFRPDYLDQAAAAVRKVVERHRDLLPGDDHGGDEPAGRLALSARRS